MMLGLIEVSILISICKINIYDGIAQFQDKNVC